jgi:6-pyruvoyltetrahydropterin/6-carboxytetrahydropterin synthase
MFHIELNGWEANIKFSASHFIPEHDKCSRLHGHTYALHLKAVGKPNEKGIVMDFVALKKGLRNLLEPLDHKTIIPSRHEALQIERNDEKGQLEVKVRNGKFYSFPLEDVIVLDIKTSSSEELSAYFVNRLIESGILPDNVEEIELGVDEGRGQGARGKKVLKR